MRRDIQQYGLKVAWHNFRWELGYAIGGFTRAWNYTDAEMREGEAQNIVDQLKAEYDLT